MTAIPYWIKEGINCNYHAIIGGPVTTKNCKIISPIYVLGKNTIVVKLDKISGVVDIEAISETGSES